jgi:hypothetical protein
MSKRSFTEISDSESSAENADETIKKARNAGFVAPQPRVRVEIKTTPQRSKTDEEIIAEIGAAISTHKLVIRCISLFEMLKRFPTFSPKVRKSPEMRLFVATIMRSFSTLAVMPLVQYLKPTPDIRAAVQHMLSPLLHTDFYNSHDIYGNTIGSLLCRAITNKDPWVINVVLHTKSPPFIAMHQVATHLYDLYPRVEQVRSYHRFILTCSSSEYDRTKFFNMLSTTLGSVISLF